ncbi:MAG TPA: polyketide synthase, partial [Stellaceae bacterium]
MANDSEDFAGLSLLKKATLAIEDLRTRLDRAERREREPIALVGMACRFPGGADDPEKFWELLRRGRDAIGPIPSGRWDVDAFFDQNPDAPGKSYCRAGAFLDRVDEFDPAFFGITAREAASMDPQQRLLLELSWEALERAGIAPASLIGTRTGVFTGIGVTDYAQLVRGAQAVRPADLYLATGNGICFAAGRIAFALGLQGPTLALDTACSSSLVAVHLACQSLRAGECDLALAGGVQLILTPEAYVILSKSKALAPDGRCKTFGAAADGFGRGEGVGLVVLKRLADAARDGDDILAVVRGSAVNHDGRSGGMTVPNGSAQAAVLRQAYASAGIAPGAVDYVEAHGTGTALGDPIELRALASVMGAERQADHPLYVGSVKSNIGHLEAAAGIASLIKLVLALNHDEIPKSLHAEPLNPMVEWAALAVKVATVSLPWRRGFGERVGGVSSFGFSGTNAHVVVSEAPAVSRPRPAFEGERGLH